MGGSYSPAGINSHGRKTRQSRGNGPRPLVMFGLGFAHCAWTTPVRGVDRGPGQEVS